MRVIGIVSEFNPFHNGHEFFLSKVREKYTEEIGIICVMSGNYVQRGDIAIIDKHTRAAVAVNHGADLVIEIPTKYVLQSAEGFARSGVYLLEQLGIVTDIYFGSESGDINWILDVGRKIDELNQLDYNHIKQQPGNFAHRQSSLIDSINTDGFRDPNNILGIEYCRAIRYFNSKMEAHTIQRFGVNHDTMTTSDSIASAFQIRSLMEHGESVDNLIPDIMKQKYQESIINNVAPNIIRNAERPILSSIKKINKEQWACYVTGNEGLHHRLYKSAQKASSIASFLETAKTKRYPLSRIRRSMLRAFLEIPISDELPKYERVLAFNSRGRSLLKIMETTSKLPMIINTGVIRNLSKEIVDDFECEVKCTNQYFFFMPDRATYVSDIEWKSIPHVKKGAVKKVP